jgi:anthranilate phosphoribosyltransferase
MEHPFAKFIQILGKGQRGARDLTQEEAEQAMSMILAHQVEPVQLGAFLMLMRVKEETAEEIAGFARAARNALPRPVGLIAVDLDWASYAGKRRQLPWYLLSALLLSSHDIRVLMHGIGDGSEERIYIPQAMQALGLKAAATLEEASARLARANFAFIPLSALNGELDRMLNLKSLLGLRSPVHTIIRNLNPLAAPASIMGIFHPGYDETHQRAAALLGDRSLAVFKGEGGEAERNPDAPCKVKMLLDGNMLEEEWPALYSSKHLKDEAMDASRLAKLWRGEIEDEYGKAAVLGTAAIALRAMGRANGIADAEAQATKLWKSRDIGYLERIKG